jgi:penicillin-binding protein 1C
LLTQAARCVGQNVRTTIDAAMQRQAMNAVREQLQLLQASGIGAAAIVIVDNTSGECRAAVSLGVEDVRIDLTRRARSTGSTLKPFIYAAAFDAGVCGPATILADREVSWAGYEPADYDRDYRGPLTAAEALAESRNIPAMRVLARVGVEKAVGVMDAAGLHTLARDPNRYGLTLAIGGAEATPLEIAQAYSALARGGVVVPVSLLVGQRTTNEVHAKFIRPQACWQVMEALSEPSRTRGLCPESVESHVAWKTGTSSGHRDAWCAAVTRRITVVAWLGNVRGEGASVLVGQEAATPLALRLVAMFDPNDEPWPVVHDSMETKSVWKEPVPDDELVVRSPSPGREIVLETDAPVEKQRVPLVAESPNGRKAPGRLWWFVDDRALGSCEAGEKLWWQPVAGGHDVRVVDEKGRSAAVKVRVRG